MTAAPDPTPAIPKRRRSKVPTVIQMEAVECGPACLAMILAHHGNFVPLDVLRDECNIGRDGTTALRLAQVARSYGLDAAGFRGDLADLQGMSTPFIAFWRFNHFVVVEGWDDVGMFINDPASGPRRVSWQQVDKDFTGIAITMEPTADFRPGGRPMSVVRRLPDLVRGYGWPLSFAALVGLFVAIPGIAAAGFLSFFVNRILGDGQSDLLAGFFLTIAAALVALVGLSWIQMRTLTETTTSLSTRMAALLTWRTLRLPMRYFTQRSSGEVAWRMSMPDILATELAGPLPAAATSAVTMVLFFVALLVVSPAVAMVALVIGLVDFLVLRLIHKHQELGERLTLQAQGRLLGEAVSGIAGIEFVKATGAEEDLFSRFTGYHATLINSRQELGALTQLLIAVPPLLRIVASASAIGIGAFAVLDGSLSLGALVALQPLLAGFLMPFATFVMLGGTTSYVSATVGKIDDVLDQEPEVVGVRTSLASDSGAPPMLAAKLVGDIEFRDVVFGYNRGATPVLAGLSFRVRPGQRIAIVGTTGAGKSTVSRLLVGLESPWSGEVLIDGVPRDQIAADVLTASLAFVEQQAVLFSGSTMDNLTLWDRSITRDRAVAGARDAAIDDVIASRPGGYDSLIDEGARNISGGQAQRLEIARALTIDPTILVLDEATSALDAATEVEIDNAIRRRGCTTVIVAHRLSTIRDADLILVLDQGSVVESGTHDQLIDNEGLYRTLVQS